MTWSRLFLLDSGLSGMLTLPHKGADFSVAFLLVHIFNTSPPETHTKQTQAIDGQYPEVISMCALE
jgi:hypothetical protein